MSFLDNSLQEKVKGERASGLFRSTWVVSSVTAVSRVLGLVRVQLMAYLFGAGLAADAFFVAFRIPNLLRDLFAEGALSTAFVPVFKKTLVKEGTASAQALANRLFTFLVIVLSAVVVIGVLISPLLVHMMAEGFADDPFKFGLTVELTRWLFPYLFFISLAALLMGILNSYGKFATPASASSVFNISLILSMWFLYDLFELPVYCLVVGVLAGGVGQFAVQIPSLYRSGHRLRFDFNFKDKGLKAVGKLAAPMTVGMAASRVNILVSTILASLQGPGAVSYLVYAYQLMHFPLGVFAVAIGTVTLPKAAEHIAKGEMEKLTATLRSSLRMVLFLVVPSAVYLAFFNSDLIRLIYERGEFTSADSAAVSLALLWYSVGLIGYAGVRVSMPIFYAFSDAKTPMRYSIWTVALNITLSLLLIQPRLFDMGFAGLAAATSIAGLFNLALLLVGLRKLHALTNIGSYLEALWKTFFASALMALVLVSVSSKISFGMSGLSGEIMSTLAEIALGALTYFVATLILGMAEAKKFIPGLRSGRR
ncbi:MAG: murein biosynthesis integral membrane protein MurJ [candidate division Zixibacteria bacterium]|nr:murein biosynthesis integral membrane protein MurJ [candidate division Zixibacteria bacterium]